MAHPGTAGSGEGEGSPLRPTPADAGRHHQLEREAALETLIELTRLPETSGDDAAIAAYLLDRVVDALGGRSGVLAQVDGDEFTVLAERDLDPSLFALADAKPLHQWRFFARLAEGTPAFIAPIAEGVVDPMAVPVARAAGYEAFAAFAIPSEDRLSAVLLVLFDQPADELTISERRLEAIGRVVAIAFANQRLRRSLSASEARYRRLFQESPDPLTLQGADGTIVDANDAALHLYRANRDELVGHDVGDYIASERFVTAIGDGIEVWRATGRRVDGSLFPEEVIVSRLELDGEDRVLARIRDLTEQERLQQELVQAQKMDAIGQLVSGVAHELNNPLAAIIAFSQLIRRDERLPQDLRRDADLLVGEADRTRRIVQNLLDFARQRPPERHPTTLAALVSSVLELEAYSLSTGQITVDVDIPADLPVVYVDRAQMQQVLLNLTLNAIHAIRSTGRPGTITLQARETTLNDEPAIRLAIADDGPGVPAEHRDRLFLPFFTTKEPGEGTGLGLSVSFGIVAGHGGQLVYEPGPGGGGAVFVITLPVGSEQLPTPRQEAFRQPTAGIASRRTDESQTAGRPPRSPRGMDPGGVRAIVPPEAPRVVAPEAPAPTAAPRVANAREHILVLDDEPTIREFLARILRRAGYAPILCGDGAEAVARVREEPVAAVLCDHRMAGMSGIEVYQALVEIRPELRNRIVFMSGDVLNAELAAFAREHGIAILAKPFDIDAVQRMVASIAGRR